MLHLWQILSLRLHYDHHYPLMKTSLKYILTTFSTRSTTCTDCPLHFHQEGFSPIVPTTGWIMDRGTQFWWTRSLALNRILLGNPAPDGRGPNHPLRGKPMAQSLWCSCSSLLGRPTWHGICTTSSWTLKHLLRPTGLRDPEPYGHLTSMLGQVSFPPLPRWSCSPTSSPLRSRSLASFPPTSPFHHHSPTTLARQPSAWRWVFRIRVCSSPTLAVADCFQDKKRAWSHRYTVDYHFLPLVTITIFFCFHIKPLCPLGEFNGLSTELATSSSCSSILRGDQCKVEFMSGNQNSVLWLTTRGRLWWSSSARQEHPRPGRVSRSDHEESSLIRSTFFSNATGIEEQALFLWAQQRTPASARVQTLALRLWAQWTLDIHEDRLEIRYQDLDGDTFQVSPTSILSWASWRPTGLNGAQNRWTLRALKSFLLTSVILWCYIYHAMHINRASLFLSPRNTCSSGEKQISWLPLCVPYGCILGLHLCDIFTWFESQVVDDLRNIRKCSLMSLQDFIFHDWFPGVFLKLHFVNAAQPWRTCFGQPPPIDLPVWTQSQMHLWTLHLGYPELHHLLAILFLRQKLMVTPPFATESTTAPFNHMDPYHRGPYFTEQTVHTITFKIYTYNGDRRELWVNEANNNGFSRLRKPEHFFFRLTGDHSMSLRLSDYWRQFFDLPLHHGGSPFADSTDNQLPVTTASPASTVPCTGISIASVALWPIGVRFYYLCSCFGDHPWHFYGPTASSCSGTSDFGIVAPFWFWCVWGSFIEFRETTALSSDKRKNPAAAGCVCVCGTSEQKQ